MHPAHGIPRFWPTPVHSHRVTGEAARGQPPGSREAQAQAPGFQDGLTLGASMWPWGSQKTRNSNMAQALVGESMDQTLRLAPIVKKLSHCHVAVGPKILQTNMAPWFMEPKSSTCGLPQSCNFEPHPCGFGSGDRQGLSEPRVVQAFRDSMILLPQGGEKEMACLGFCLPDCCFSGFP